MRMRVNYSAMPARTCATGCRRAPRSTPRSTRISAKWKPTRPELNLSVFETFQEERRPFFVEDGETFDTPIDLFYSRRIGRQPGYHSLPDGHDALNESESTTILGAAKLTGKTASKTTFGLLTALTAKEYARIGTTMVREVSGEEFQERSDFLVEPRTHFLVGRVKQDLFTGNSHIGLLGTAVQRDRARGALYWRRGLDPQVGATTATPFGASSPAAAPR